MTRFAPRKPDRCACVYCGGVATEGDHVPPRCLLEKPYPPDLTTIPACTSCNRRYSRDEEYFLTVLSHIGTSLSLTAKIEAGGVVDRALTRSPGFDERIQQSLVPDRGRVLFAPEHDRILNVIRKVAFGLFIIKYGCIPVWEDIDGVGAYPYNIEDGRPTHLFIATYTERFMAKRWTTVQRGVFSHIVVRNGVEGDRLCFIMDFHKTLWGVAYLPRPTARLHGATGRTKNLPEEQISLFPRR